MKIKLPLLVAATSVMLSSGAFAVGELYSDNNHAEVVEDRSGSATSAEIDVAISVANDIDGVMVENPQGEIIGEIDRAVQDKFNNKLVIIGLSGSLKEVAVPFAELHWKDNGRTTDHTFVISTPRSELDDRKDIDPFDFEELDPAGYDEYEFSRFEEKTSGAQ